MTLSRRYREAVAYALQRHPSAELLPLVLALACVEAFPVAGAGLSLTEKVRVPLAASDATVSEAERLQTTLGEGPCLDASRTGTALVADLDALHRRWPVFTSQITLLTPFRSVVSVPLRSPEEGPFGALDLYSTEPDAAAFGPVDTIETAVAGLASALLMASPTAVDFSGLALPMWLDTDLVHDRTDVWMAVGMLMAYSALTNDDALAALRAYAYSRELTLDEVSYLLISRQVAPRDIAG